MKQTGIDFLIVQPDKFSIYETPEGKQIWCYAGVPVFRLGEIKIEQTRTQDGWSVKATQSVEVIK